MRLSILPLLVMPCIFLAGSYSHHAGRANAKSRKSDTIFIEREKGKDYYCKVYIEKKRQSGTYRLLIDFTMNKFENDEYKEQLNAMKKKLPGTLSKYHLADLPKEWLPLYRYKGKYYVYSPGEEGTEGRRFLTDSTMVYWFMDGPYPVPLSSAVAINPQTWHLELHSFSDGAHAVNLSIHIIAPKTKMAIWEDDDKPESTRYELFIPKESVKDFDMIVARCDKIKTAEFGSFDQIDYKALLAGH